MSIYGLHLDADLAIVRTNPIRWQAGWHDSQSYRQNVKFLSAFLCAVCALFAYPHFIPHSALAQEQNGTTEPTIARPYPNRSSIDEAQWSMLSESTPPSNHVATNQGEITESAVTAPLAPQFQTTYWWGVFQSFRDGNWELYRVRGTGVDFARLTYHPAADTLPRFNNDVTQIVFVSDRDGNPEIYRMAETGANPTRLTVNEAIDTQPAWSPDGTAIVFASDRTGNGDLFVIDKNGGNSRQLTTDPAVDLFPDWSPNGAQIVWVRIVGDSGQLWVMNRDGSNAHAVSGALRYLQHPRWSPDGNAIAFDYDADNDGLGEIGILTLATGAIQSALDLSPAIPAEGWDLLMNAWSPTGEGIHFTYVRYFWANAGGHYEFVIREIRTDGFCLPERCNLLNVSLFGNDADSDHFLDVRSTDLTPPQSSVDALPQFTRHGSLFVSWTATDPGGSGAVLYDVDYRAATDPSWQNWQNRNYVVGDRFGFEGDQRAQTFYFRSRAVDDAENVEPWPTDPKGDTAVTFYATTVRGEVTDMRGIGRTGETVPILPAAMNDAKTDTHGDYFARLPLNGEYQVNGLRIKTDADRTLPFYLEPTKNLIKNGDFETFPALSGWSQQGPITPTLTSANVSSGLQGVHLGIDCAAACVITDTSVPTEGEISYYSPLWTDDGHLHLFYSTYDPAGQGNLYHTEEQSPGNWSTPFLLGTGSAYGLRAVADQEGNRFVVLGASLPTGNTIVTLAYTPSGGWGPMVPFDQGVGPQLAIDGDGSLHLFYIQQCAPNCWERALVYRRRPVNGDWSSAIVVSSAGFEGYRLLVGNDNIAHLFWYQENERFKHSNNAPRLLTYQRYQQGVALGAAIIVDDRSIFNDYRLDLQDNLFAFGSGNSGILFAETPLEHAGTDAPYIVDSFRTLTAWGPDATLYALAPDHASGAPWHFLYKAAGQRWSTPQPLDLHDYYPEWIHIDDAGQFQALTYDGKLIHFPPKVGAGRGSLAQSVSIPADLHKPTLSWMVETRSSHQGRSNFQVTIRDSLSETVIYSTTASAPWQLQWADLSPWAGQTITVTFAVSQAAGAIPFQADLDHIALGAWTTPVPQAITPAQVEADIQTSVVISGENFIATPQVRVGGKALTNVRLVSSSAVAGTIPADLAPGIYDLIVINPTGENTVLPNAVRVGKQLYLPIVVR